MRPFDDRRDGLVLGEACSALVIGPGDSDRFHFLSGANVCDTHSMVAAHPGGSTIAAVMHEALTGAKLAAGDITAVKAHGTANPANDDAEAAGLTSVFAPLPPICALKPHLGHTLGASGLTELVLFYRALESGFLAATPGIGGRCGDRRRLAEPGRAAHVARVLHAQLVSASAGATRRSSSGGADPLGAIHILATGSYLASASDELPSLKSLAYESTGVVVRRVGRFVQLALVGAGRCVDGRTLPPDTATYVTSVRGDLEATLEGLADVCERGRSPAPFTFINTVGNSACFHVAKCFGLRGRSQFVTSRFGAFEAALRLATLDMTDDRVTTALVGSIDAATVPLSAHRERIGVGADRQVGEASHWLLLSSAPSETPALGVVRRICRFPDHRALIGELTQERGAYRDAALAWGAASRSDRSCVDTRGCRGAPGARLPSRPPMVRQPGGARPSSLPDRARGRDAGSRRRDPSGRRSLVVIDATPDGEASSKPPPRDRRIA
jgi:3-oxoacyl-(acyl-carrier-protein) synthase